VVIGHVVIVAGHTAEANCKPLSDAKQAGTLYLETQLLLKASVQSAAGMPRSGKASIYLALSTAVKTYANLFAATCRGPTKSRAPEKICTWC
jgi:hypothetical protein